MQSRDENKQDKRMKMKQGRDAEKWDAKEIEGTRKDISRGEETSQGKQAAAKFYHNLRCCQHEVQWSSPLHLLHQHVHLLDRQAPVRCEHPIRQYLSAPFHCQIRNLHVPDCRPVSPLHRLIGIRVGVHSNDDAGMALDRQPVQNLPMIVSIHLVHPIQEDDKPAPAGLVRVLEQKLEASHEVHKVSRDNEVEVEPAADQVAETFEDRPDVPRTRRRSDEVIQHKVVLELLPVPQSVHYVGNQTRQPDPGLAMHHERRRFKVRVAILGGVHAVLHDRLQQLLSPDHAEPQLLVETRLVVVVLDREEIDGRGGGREPGDDALEQVLREVDFEVVKVANHRHLIDRTKVRALVVHQDTLQPVCLDDLPLQVQHPLRSLHTLRSVRIPDGEVCLPLRVLAGERARLLGSTEQALVRLKLVRGQEGGVAEVEEGLTFLRVLQCRPERLELQQRSSCRKHGAHSIPCRTLREAIVLDEPAILLSVEADEKGRAPVDLVQDRDEGTLRESAQRMERRTTHLKDGSEENTTQDHRTISRIFHQSFSVSPDRISTKWTYKRKEHTRSQKASHNICNF
eukprot:751152-Hanusia_phi.AAC.2